MAMRASCRRRRTLNAVVAAAAVAVTALAGSAWAANSDVCASSTCIANGESECDRATGDCPPCMYQLSTGSFSCYDLGDSGACPYDDTYTICDSGISSATASNGSTAASTTAPSSTTAAPSSTTAAPSSTTAAPSSTTAAPSSTTAAPSSTTAPLSNSSSSRDNGDSNVAGTVTPIVKTTGSGSGSAAAGSLRASSTTPSPSSSSSAIDASSDSEGSSTAETASSKPHSSDVAMMAALISAAGVGVIVLAVFIAHRVRKNRRGEREPYGSSFGTDGTVFALPPGSTKGSNMAFASRTYSAHLTPTAANSITVLGGGSEYLDGSIVILADSEARGSTRQPSVAAPTLLSMSSLSSSTADFSLGPQFRLDQSGGGDLTSSTTSLKTHPASPMMPLDASLTRRPVSAARSNFVPNAIVEGREDEDEFSSFEQQSRYVRLASAESVILSTDPFAPDSSGVSITSTMSSLADTEYDIVDPHTIREGERRNTEVVVRDSAFPKFSTFSESDLLGEDEGDEGDVAERGEREREDERGERGERTHPKEREI